MNPIDRFDFAVKVVLKHEGGFSNDPNDPGGPTNFGIDLRFLKEIGFDINHDGVIDIKDIEDIHFTDAVDIYKKYWWDKYGYDRITSLAVATKIFDMAVNMGGMQAHKIAQESCNYLGYSLTVDGILGSITLATLNIISLHGGESTLMDEIVTNQQQFYQNLVEEHPKLSVFLKGWLNRAAYTGLQAD